MKVRITGSMAALWYSDQVGKVFDVNPEIETYHGPGEDLYRLRPGGYGIFVRDCVPVD